MFLQLLFLRLLFWQVGALQVLQLLFLHSTCCSCKLLLLLPALT
jgi:hypothetical protein